MLSELVLKNRSYRSFDEKRKITRAELADMVENARVCPSAANLQPLSYRLVYDGGECKKILAATKWAGYLPRLRLPPEGHAPTGYIIICRDPKINASKELCALDAGICAQTIMLSAAEAGLGGCIIASFDEADVKNTLKIPDGLSVMLVLALGMPDEEVRLTELHDSVRYFRENGVHYVPKRSAEDVIL